MRNTSTKTLTRADLQACENYEATYAPEDDKLRLYVGRVPREEYDFLRAEGWTSTPKQSEAGQGEFSAVWTPAREATALHYAGEIGDEDTPPTERAADRAERFGGYMVKRADEAGQHADNYDSQPSAHGFQSERKAERAAARHDRQGDKATDQWSKAEYWQRRTAGVIEHALHKSSPGVRMGRIKTLEAELRKREADQAAWIAQWDKTAELVADTAPFVSHVMEQFNKSQAEAERDVAEVVLGSCAKVAHPRNGDPEKKYIFELIKDPDPVTLADFCAIWKNKYPTRPTAETKWTTHLKLRLAYENQMLEAQGGRAAMVEMEVGGWLGKHQIRKINRSNATGRVVSVGIMWPTHGKDRWGNEDPKAPSHRMEVVNIERLESSVYSPPSTEDKATLADAKKAEKKAAPKVESCPLINPTDEDAEQLQALWNDKATECGWYQRNGGKPSEVLRMTQAQYSANSGGSYAGAGTVTVCEHGTKHETRSGDTISRHSVFKIRATSNGYSADRVIVITDKPQKKIPWAAVKAARAKEPTIDSLRPRFDELNGLLKGRNGWLPDSKTDEYKLMQDARYCGLWFISSMSQFGWTDKGAAIYKAHQQSEQPATQELQAA